MLRAGGKQLLVGRPEFSVLHLIITAAYLLKTKQQHPQTLNPQSPKNLLSPKTLEPRNARALKTSPKGADTEHRPHHWLLDQCVTTFGCGCSLVPDHDVSESWSRHLACLTWISTFEVSGKSRSLKLESRNFGYSQGPKDGFSFKHGAVQLRRLVSGIKSLKVADLLESGLRYL